VTGLQRLGRTTQEADVTYFKLTAPKFAGRYPGKPRKFSFVLQAFPNIWNNYVPVVCKVGNEYTYGQWNLIGSSMTVPSPLLLPSSILPPPLSQSHFFPRIRRV